MFVVALDHGDNGLWKNDLASEYNRLVTLDAMSLYYRQTVLQLTIFEKKLNKYDDLCVIFA